MKEDKKIARSLQDLIAEHHVDDIQEGEVIVDVSLDMIVPNIYQPRRIFDPEKIQELAESIKEHGVFQPIILKKQVDGYMIVAGERRFRAAKSIDLKKIPAIIRAYQEDKIAQIALVENLQRENLTAIEEAEAYLSVMKHLKLTQQQLADKIGKSRAHVTNILGLLNLPDTVQTMILNQQISMGHARALSKLDDTKTIEQLAHRIVKENLSVRTIESLTQSEKKTKEIKRKSKPIIYKRYEKKILQHLGVKAIVTASKITLEVSDDETLNKIVGFLLDEHV